MSPPRFGTVQPPAGAVKPPAKHRQQPDWAAVATARTLAASLTWSSHAPSSHDAASNLRSPGWVGLSHGLPRHWAWGVFSLVEALHEAHADQISASLAAALDAEEAEDAEEAAEAAEGRERKVARTSSAEGSTRLDSSAAPQDNARPGERAAAKVTAELHRHGLAISVYAGPPSQSQAPPYADSGSRFYVSATQVSQS